MSQYYVKKIFQSEKISAYSLFNNKVKIVGLILVDRAQRNVSGLRYTAANFLS